MTEHKFTDEEVIKALECCKTGACLVCPYQIVYAICRDVMCGDTLELINRQRVEIEQLNHKYELAVAERKANAKALIDMTIESAEKYPWERTNERHD